jgi:quercetin dioxygenase-like cupin family protein
MGYSLDYRCALGPNPVASPSQVRSIRRRLLERVADADQSHLTLADADGEWQPFTLGVRLKVLRERDGVMSYLLRLEPGATLPPHRHPCDEECLVLDGVLQVGTRLELHSGGYHVAHQGALHASISTKLGATIFLRGAVPEMPHVLD